MKHVRLLCTVLSLTTVGGWAVANACENDKSSQASAASYSTAASTCTAAQAAACKSEKAKVGATAAAAHGACTAEQAAACKAHGVSATTASMDHCAGKTAATTAAMDHCAGKTTAATAGSDHCAGKTSAAMASAEHCNSNTSAAAHSCGNAKASTAMAGGHCNGQGIAKVAYMSEHTDCDACVDMTASAEEIDAIGATSQMVPLKNGVMFVYTTDSPSKAHAVQAALARRSERMAAMTTAGDRAHLCSECKAMRGAAASGKLNREVVNIEGGCLTLMTSNDPRIVAKIHSMVGVQTAARVKL